MNENAQTIKEVVDVAVIALQPLADKVNQTAGYVWSLQVKQAYIDGVCYLGGLLVGTIFMLGAYLVFNLDVKQIPKEDRGLCVVLSIILFVIGICVFKAYLPEALQCFLNPEYYALKQLINLAK